jgi:hypothetical protein
LHVYRSSNDATSGSLDDQNRFRIQTRDVQLEHIAQSQEKDADDVERCERPSASIASKKASAEKDIIHVTSSGGPPESSRHVSTQLFLICFSNITPRHNQGRRVLVGV